MDDHRQSSSSFLRHAAIYGFGNVLIYAGSFLLLPIYVRCLSESEYGELDLIKHVGDVLVLCMFYNGLRQALFAFYNQAKSPEERREVVGAILALTACLFLIGGLFILPFVSTFAAWLRLRSPHLLRYGLIAVAADSYALLLLAISQARLHSTFFVMVSIGQFLIRSTLSIVLVAVLRWGAWGALTASLMTSVSMILFLLLREMRDCSFKRSRATVISALSFALPFIPGGIGFFLLHSGDRFFLVKVTTTAELGAYALGYKLALVVALLSRRPLYQVWSARMYFAAGQPNAPALFGRVFTRIISAYLFVGLGLCTLNREVVTVLAGDRFQNAAAVIVPLVAAYLFLTAADLMDAGLYVTRKTKWKTLITSISTLATLSFYAVLIPAHGIRGAAWATLLGFMTHAIVTYLITRRVFRTEYEWRRLAIVAISCVAFCAAAQLLPFTWWLCPVKLLLCFAWPVALWRFKVITNEEKTWLRDSLRRTKSFCSRALLGRRPMDQQDTWSAPSQRTSLSSSPG